MKSKILIIILLFPLLLHAESKSDSISNWKWAAGVTLWSNAKYNGDLQRKEPILELDASYRLKGSHLINLHIPVLIRQKYPCRDAWSRTAFKNIDKYYELLEDDRIDMEQVQDYSESFYGASLGYQYNYDIRNWPLAAFAGMDVLYFHRTIHSLVYGTVYNPSETGNGYETKLCYTSTYRSYEDRISLQPVIGLRYRLSHLMLEGYLSYFQNFFQGGHGHYDSVTGSLDYSFTSSGSWYTNQLVYGLRLYYLF